MDIISHGIWASLAAKTANKQYKRPLNLRLAFFFGVFPDLFAFTLPFIFLLWSFFFYGTFGFDMRNLQEIEGSPQNAFPVAGITYNLYRLSHSAIIFLLVFFFVFLFLKRPIFEMLGWFLHILIDIPTHTYKFFPTPFLWPVSDFKIDGFSWGTPWFLILNYGAIIFVYLILRLKKGKI